MRCRHTGRAAVTVFSPPPHGPCGTSTAKAYPQVFAHPVHTGCGKPRIGPLLAARPVRTLPLSPLNTLRWKASAPPEAMKSIEHRDFTLSPEDNERLANLCGPFDGHLRQIELKLGVEIANRGFVFRISGPNEAIVEAQKLVEALYAEAGETTFDNHAIHLRLAQANVEQIAERSYEAQEVAIKVKRGTVRGRGANQARYLHQIATHDINFGIGPAGTGKTFLAVASAVEALNESRVQRLILVRPAVEAGEKLGFLPGDLSQKVDPYLRPLYDALYEMMGVEKVVKLLERNVIEIAPLAYMRGRTLNDAFVILDEAQNTTIEQMKMFLTRLGYGSTAVVTGDLTQTDLPAGKSSGLKHAVSILAEIRAIRFIYFNEKDVVRHRLVQDIITAYE